MVDGYVLQIRIHQTLYRNLHVLDNCESRFSAMTKKPTRSSILNIRGRVLGENRPQPSMPEARRCD